MAPFFKFFFFAFFLIITPVLSQQSNVKTFSTKHGLVNSNVIKVIQDKSGFLWIATESGLSKFNGKSFTNYTIKNGLPGNNITSLCEDKNGNIWLSVIGVAIVKFNGKDFEIFNEKNGLKHLSIYSTLCDSKGNVWFTTQDGEIYKFDGTTFIHYNKKNGLQSAAFYSIAEDKSGNIWFGTKEKGVCKFDGEKFQFISDSKGFLTRKGTIVYSMCFDSEQTLWIGTTNSGVYNIKEDKVSPYFISEDLSSDFIADIKSDIRGNIWIASSYGVIKNDNNGFHYYNENNGLAGNTVQSLCLDYESNLWIGTIGTGLSVLKNESFITFTEKDGLSSNYVTTTVRLNENEILIGTNGKGVNKYNGRTVEHLKNDKILSEGNITKLFLDKNQNLWVAKESGLSILKHSHSTTELTIAHKTLVEKLSNQIIMSVMEDLKGNIWITTMGSGVFMFDGKEYMHYNSENGLEANGALCAHVDKQGNIWLGTFQQGILKYDGNKFEKYGKEDGLSDNTVWAIAEDNQGNLFFGTAEGGLNIYDGKKNSSLNTINGLCSDLIVSIAIDLQNNIWLGTDKGLNKLKLNDELKIESLRYYGEQDGLRSTEINHNGLRLDKDGTLWIATLGGITKYNPSLDYLNSTPPKIALSGIKLFYQDVDWKKYSDSINNKTQLPSNLTLSYKNNHLTFNFQALTTNNVKYSYILENLEDEWSPQHTSNEAVYSNIPHGNYTFKVKAINNDGYWSEEIVYSFSIAPPFWKTWWFYVILSSLIIISILSFIKWRTAKLEKEKKVLEHKVDIRTKELQVAHNKLSYAYQDIKDSIQYAKQIQDAILPLPDDLKKSLPESFIFFKPRDVVSGDFYWFNVKNDITYFAAVDCTGHGVPGAFMSMIGNTLLNEIINKQNVSQPAAILNQLNEEIRKALKQDREMFDSKDGMDIAFCSLDYKQKILEYSGARRPLYIIRNDGKFEEIKGDKLSIGGVQLEEKTIFTNHTIQLDEGDTIYIFSDGYVDQFGGPKGKKFTSKRLQDLIIGIKDLSMKEQLRLINENLTSWTGAIEQIDDILVMGVRV